MKNITFSITFQDIAYLVRVSKNDALLPIHFTAFIFDDELRTKYGELIFQRKNHQSPIEPTFSNSAEEVELKEVILKKIMHNIKTFIH